MRTRADERDWARYCDAYNELGITPEKEAELDRIGEAFLATYVWPEEQRAAIARIREQTRNPGIVEIEPKE